jgi:hypothetical protein
MELYQGVLQYISNHHLIARIIESLLSLCLVLSCLDVVVPLGLLHVGDVQTLDLLLVSNTIFEE